MKCFEKLVLGHIKDTIPDTLDPLQFAYCHNRYTEEAISHTLHTTLAHLDNKNWYARLLFVDYSSGLNAVIPTELIHKLVGLGLSDRLCNRILDFLTDRPQFVRIGRNISSPLTLNNGTSQGRVLSPVLYSLFTGDRVARYSSNTVIKFADDTTIVGLITNKNEMAYRKEVRLLAEWCPDNNLSLNVSKTKELVIDFRKQDTAHAPIYIGGEIVERVNSFRFLGITLTAKLTWTEHTATTIKKAHQHLHFLMVLKKARISTTVLTTFYRCAVESILTGCITSWCGSCSIEDKKALQRVVKTAHECIGTQLPAVQDIYTTGCLRKTMRIMRDHSHPARALFSFLLSGKRLRSIRTRTTRYRNSFYPSAVRVYNTHQCATFNN
uniref:Reverse transcriptase domain-containing protein n=1 Tax=Scleropages formosus TaxID=113540 RepID=A0A8C9SXC6_SCLFO